MVTDADAFIAAHTLVGVTPLVPQIRLHLAHEITPIWQASEAWLARNGIEPPFWAFAWPGGQAMARHVLDHPELVTGRRVLDFAAGGGIAAIGLNAGLNGVTIIPLAADVVGLASRWDLILCGDVCYEAPMTRHILPWLRRCAATTRVHVADPGRAYLPGSGLDELARYDVVTSLELEDRTLRPTTIYRLLPAA